MGSDFCSCQHFFVKTENESNMYSNSRKDLSSIENKNTLDKRFDEKICRGMITNQQLKITLLNFT